MLSGILIATWYGCESEPDEVCVPDDYCEVTVTVCCKTENDCVYKYNGKEYTEDQLDELDQDLGCNAVNVKWESTDQKSASSDVKERLKAQMARVKALVKSGK